MIETRDLPAPDDAYVIRRALLSVYDKTGIVPFARFLADRGVELISSGGTAQRLRNAGLEVTTVAAATNFPEILHGRVKTLHPAIHGGLLAMRTDTADMDELDALGIQPIDLVVVNLYPFEDVVARTDVSLPEAVENIDIGGSALLRASAKNHAFVATVCQPSAYDAIQQEMTAHDGALTAATRRRLATAAFQHTAAYDTAIAGYMETATAGDDEKALPPRLRVDAPQAQALRYGENPHQPAGFYGDATPHYRQLHGKPLSYNNLLDLDAALALMGEFAQARPTCAIFKHTNPCGVATADTLSDAYARAFATDRQSPFGGIVAVNEPLDMATAEAIDEVFTEIILAPAFPPDVRAFLEENARRRLIEVATFDGTTPPRAIRTVRGGYLMQASDPALPPLDEMRAAWTVVTDRAPAAQEWNDLDLAWRVAKHVKSNAIVYALNHATVGVGAGQMSRIDAAEVAAQKAAKSELALKGAVVASDAFFPFADGLLAAADRGITAAIQPGGSIRDDEVIAAANDRGMAMVCTGTRHFRH